MREIKYRAWDKKYKSMKEVARLDIQSKEVAVYDFMYNVGILKRDEIELMQYTGLTDINDIEICENDLVKYYGYEEPLLVVFENGAFGLKFPLKMIPLNKWLIDNKKIEIVGHIYE